MKEELIRLLNEYKETEVAIEEYMVYFKEKDYALGKLDEVRLIISDLERLVKQV
ncbi:MAG: hypothetical protein ACRC2K_04795 [Clostridium sp.]